MTRREKALSQALSDSPPLPRAFGRYALFDRIGKGGMAEIFLAQAHTELGGTRLVVVKQILPELAATTRFADLLVTEAKLAARLSHANVVQVTDLGREGDQLYIAMEYVEGFDLSDLLRRCSRTRTPLPIEFAMLVVIEVLRGLDYAHRRKDDQGRPLGIVHRDLSPSNVLLSFEGEVKLCDFGIAHAFGAATTAENLIEGKAGYMSPEHARGEKLDARADVFAVGIVLWELVSGRRYYRANEGLSLIEVAQRALYEDPTPRDLPHEEELVAILRRALSQDRDARYPSAQAMLRDLEGYVGKAGLVASPLRLGTWLRETFGADMIEQRRSRERAAAAKMPSLAPPSFASSAPPPVQVPRAPAVPRLPAPPSAAAERHAAGPASVPAPVASSRRPLVVVVAIVLAIAVAAVVFVLARR